ncbi:MAG: hypothetical protein H6713_24135 [Myxococcales bacterium]|nr:hypothetical protein [Myxococcales bacterium]MCB9753057.1 hypothetical protein [Myxococcales bacterium]
MDSSQRAELLRRIYSIVTAAGSSPIVRRHFHYRAKEALRDYALPGRAPAAGLPVNLDLLDVYLDELSVFGPDDAPACAEPPLPVRLVVYGAKPLALLHDVEPALHSARAWCDAHGLWSALGPHAFVVAPEAGKGSYRNLARDRVPARGLSGGQRTLLVARDRELVVAGFLALLLDWDEYLGELLGYPRCCARAFTRRWPIAVREHDGDIAGMIARESEHGPKDWRTSIYARYFGVELIQHFPCRLDCAATVALAERHLAALDAFEPGHAAALRERLATLVLYAGEAGVFAFPGASRDGEEPRWTYDPARVHATPDDDARPDALGPLIASATTLRQREGEVWIGERRVAGTLLDFSTT